MDVEVTGDVKAHCFMLMNRVHVDGDSSKHIVKTEGNYVIERLS